MKKIVIILACSFTLAACGSNNNDQAGIQATKTADSLRMEIVKQHTIDSMNAVAAQPMQVSNEPVTAVATTPHHVAHVTHNSYTTNTTNTTVTNPAGTPAATAAAPQKKGWSAKAKGAVIGAGVGAVGGALIDSKHKGDAVKGGVIGGVLGAAAGLGAGAIIDNKKKQKDAPDENK